jgi:hypothetical protein
MKLKHRYPLCSETKRWVGIFLKDVRGHCLCASHNLCAHLIWSTKANICIRHKREIESLISWGNVRWPLFLSHMFQKIIKVSRTWAKKKKSDTLIYWKHEFSEISENYWLPRRCIIIFHWSHFQQICWYCFDRYSLQLPIQLLLKIYHICLRSFVGIKGYSSVIGVWLEVFVQDKLSEI